MVDANYNSQRYHEKQKARVEADRAKIANRDAAATDGRAIPDTGDVPIGVGRRVTAAIMFIDICGFSSRSSNSLAEQESILRVLAFFFAEVIRIIEDYGGVVEKNTGDGLMAYFNKDGTHDENEAQRAVAAALTIFYTSETLLNPVIERSNLQRVDFRICIDHGAITIASLGAAKRFNSFVAIGASANVACKFLKLADKNQILIGDDVRTLLPQDWQQRFCTLLSSPTGFHRVATGEPYTCYEYIGRWQGVLDDR